jgi:hypothetical protein
MVDLMNFGTLNATMLGTIIVGIISFGLTIYSVYLNWKQAKVDANTKIMIAELQKANATLGDIKSMMQKEKK